MCNDVIMCGGAFQLRRAYYAFAVSVSGSPYCGVFVWNENSILIMGGCPFQCPVRDRRIYLNTCRTQIETDRI